MFIKHRRSAAGWIAAVLLATLVIAGVVGARSVEAAPPTWTVSWSLNPSNDIEELSRSSISTKTASSTPIHMRRNCCRRS